MNLNFAENFKRLRKEKEITQEKLAEALDVSSQSISRWELSICYPDIELLPTIANFFGVTVDSLLSNDANSKQKDLEIFHQTVYKLSDETTERIDFIKEYCRKYPKDDYFVYELIFAIKDHAVGNKERTDQFMPLMLKNAQRLLDTRYRSITIELMAMVCDEKDLDTWLDKAPYHDFSRRNCLINRCMSRKETYQGYVQQGLHMFESMGSMLDSRFPDQLGAKRKIEYQRSILNTVKSFGKDGIIPDGWIHFFAYKQLVLSACLFGNGEAEEGWQNFDSAIELLKQFTDNKEEWLDIGGVMFSDLKVSHDWNYAIDLEGNKHKLFAMVNMSFFNMSQIYDLLTNKRWAWFNSVRGSKKYISAVKWVESIKEQRKK